MDFSSLGNLGNMMGDKPDISGMLSSLEKPDYEMSKEYGAHKDGGEFNALTDYELPSLEIESLTVRSGSIIDGLIVTYSDGSTVQHGGGGGTTYKITLNGDGIKRITGQSGVSFASRRVISQLRIETMSGKKYGPFGSSGGGNAFELYNDGKTIVAFFGSSDSGYISSIGACFLKK